MAKPYKRVIIHERRVEAVDIEERSGFTFHSGLRIQLEKRLAPFRTIMKKGWFKNTELCRVPRITDFLSVQYAEETLREKGGLQLRERIYDDKFHILHAASLLFPDLAYYRTACELRGTPLCVAYVDIDDFKQFNKTYSEPRVDRDVLPKFMSALEAHVYSHGHAYRIGGDEYVIILPNMSSSEAINFLQSLQLKLGQLDYFEIDKHTEVSIGIFEVTEDSIYTDREIEERAAHAKGFAKKNGKNTIATHEGQDSENQDVYVVAGEKSKNS